MDFPHVPYLVSIAIGDWATTRSEWEDVELSVHVPKPFAADAERSFANTARILAFLSAETGVKYPYAAYRQTCVTDYMHGGMENIAATTLTPDTLHDARAHVDWPSESLVAHEAAHQWFGDYVTCTDWSDTWLNEGFATYYAALAMGENFGPDQLVEELDRVHDSALKADAGAKRRPIVANTFKNSNEMFDGHSSAKGASVLHALRRELGDAPFRKAIRAWLETHAGQSANTHALIATIEASTGREVSRFFDQWLFRAGQPEFEVSWKWQSGAVQLTVVQAQERGPLVGLFDVPLDVQVLGDDFTLDREVRVSAERETFHLDVPQRPRAVVADRPFKAPLRLRPSSQDGWREATDHAIPGLSGDSPQLAVAQSSAWTAAAIRKASAGPSVSAPGGNTTPGDLDPRATHVVHAEPAASSLPPLAKDVPGPAHLDSDAAALLLCFHVVSASSRFGGEGATGADRQSSCGLFTAVSRVAGFR